MSYIQVENQVHHKQFLAALEQQKEEYNKRLEAQEMAMLALHTTLGEVQKALANLQPSIQK